jgi:hypothetical protein
VIKMMEGRCRRRYSKRTPATEYEMVIMNMFKDRYHSARSQGLTRISIAGEVVATFNRERAIMTRMGYMPYEVEHAYPKRTNEWVDTWLRGKTRTVWSADCGVGVGRGVREEESGRGGLMKVGGAGKRLSGGASPWAEESDWTSCDADAWPAPQVPPWGALGARSLEGCSMWAGTCEFPGGVGQGSVIRGLTQFDLSRQAHRGPDTLCWGGQHVMSEDGDKGHAASSAVAGGGSQAKEWSEQEGGEGRMGNGEETAETHLPPAVAEMRAALAAWTWPTDWDPPAWQPPDPPVEPSLWEGLGPTSGHDRDSGTPLPW